MMSCYYTPEFEMVVAQYRRLDGQQAIDKFVERRVEYVASVSKVSMPTVLRNSVSVMVSTTRRARKLS